MPTIFTLRVDTSITKKTRNRVKPALVQASSVKKSQAVILSQCEQNQVVDHVLLSWGPSRTPLAATVVLAGNEFPMPSEYCLWREHGSELSKQSPADYLALGRQTTFLLDTQ